MLLFWGGKAGSPGCRFATSFRAVVDQGRVSPGEWVAVHGCGGVGLSAIMISSALGANVIAIDIDDAKLEFARSVGANVTLNASTTDCVARAVRELIGGGAHVSLDALGSPETCYNSVANLRKRGRHIQVGLMVAEHRKSALPVNKIVAYELEIYGSHGMQAYRYPAMLVLIQAGKLDPARLVRKRIRLEQAPSALVAMDSFQGTGVTVIDQF